MHGGPRTAMMDGPWEAAIVHDSPLIFPPFPASQLRAVGHFAPCDGGGASGGSFVSGTSSSKTHVPPDLAHSIAFRGKVLSPSRLA
jgi:hypothetical protein